MTDVIAYLFTHVQSGEMVVDLDPDYWQGEREMWHRQPLYPVLQKPLSVKQIEEILQSNKTFYIFDIIRCVEKKHGIM